MYNFSRIQHFARRLPNGRRLQSQWWTQHRPSSSSSSRQVSRLVRPSCSGGSSQDYSRFNEAVKLANTLYEARFKTTSAATAAKDDMVPEDQDGPTASNMKLIPGPKLDFVIGKVANLTESSVLGSSGQTVALATMATATAEQQSGGSSGKESMDRQTLMKHFLKQTCREESSSTMIPLTVDYRQRHHAVGKIPTTANRADNRRPTNAETLASRAIDRALRPLLQTPPSSSQGLDSVDSAIHLTSSIQACPVTEDGSSGGHPVALALNSAAVALGDRLKEPVAAVYLCLMKDGRVLEDPSISLGGSRDGSEQDGVLCELLYAGTKDSVVMMEFAGELEESKVMELIYMAHKCIQPRLEIQQKANSNVESSTQQNDTDDDIRKALGLDQIEKPKDGNITMIESEQEMSSKARTIYDEAFQFCKKQLGDVPLCLFGVDAAKTTQASTLDKIGVTIHSEAKDGPLPGKAARGRREHLVHEEVRRILETFDPSDSDTSRDYQALLEDDDSTRSAMSDAIGSRILKEAMQEAAVKHGRRADGRSTNTVRPLSIDVPALPNVVHGSAVFTRGETQVLCTTTLGPPKDGILLNDPYLLPPPLPGKDDSGSAYADLPVGSLRYLRNQEYLESDLNSRKVKASREQTGDSGTLRERRRAFLQYDFPSYSKGEVQSGPGASASRREIGHGALAEKSIIPILPSASEFPYALRMTSEVTSSNGSSSMASVCGVTLSLLDAGVPIRAPAAGVSIGLANDGSQETLLLDLTGTEDHYGQMDFKIAGTANEVTAFQLDVKQPLPLSLVSGALELAKEGRVKILKEMEIQSEKSSHGELTGLRPRSDLKPSAPRVEVVKFDPVRKRDLLGPGGVVIRQMEDRFNVSLDLTQEGQCLLFGDDRLMVKKAKAAVMDLVSDVEVGLTYQGTVIELRDFGAIIELLRNKEGLCHISELAERDQIRKHSSGNLGLVNELLQVGQKIDVVCTAVDAVQGTIRVRPASKVKAT